MAFIDYLVSNVQSHSHLVSLVASIFIGEEAMLFLAFLAGEGIIPLWQVFFYSIVGIAFADSIIFWLGRAHLVDFLKRKVNVDRYKKAINFIHKTAGKSEVLSLTLSKFVYGSRMVTIFYFSSKKHSFRRFLLSDIISLAVWSGIMVSLAWLAGKGLSISFHAVKHIEKVVTIIFLFLVVLYIINKFFRMWLAHKSN
ncbi:VTT domain-containing protein [Candidatus Pacearchaeota archaeon]|nr:VTT domain-containing protein [Candidatus Pacearchaeota archaeon]